MIKEQKPQIDWFPTIFLTVTPLIAIIGSVAYIYQNGLSWSLILLYIFFYYATGFSVTAGYHRYFAHRTYEASPIVKILFLFFGAGAFQNSVLKWAVDHRFHHKYVDTDQDPYNAKRGLWYSHILWMMQKNYQRQTPMALSLSRDLRADKWIVWQDKYYVPIAVLAGFVLPAVIAASWGAAWGGFIFAGLLRMVCVHHFTFFINSLCHYWGEQKFTNENTAKDNFFLALVTYGEGYHNFHHYFQNDYRNGIYWYNYDPTKWFINTLSSLNLVDKLKVEPEQNIIRARMRMDELRLATKINEKNHIFQDKLIRMREKITHCGEQLKKLQEEYNQMRWDWVKRKSVQFELLKKEIKLTKLELRKNYSYWKKIIVSIEKLSYVR